MKNRLSNLAKKLRREMTIAERVIWRQLRAKQFENLKFRRQQPIGDYIVDFVCFEKKIIIEVDGGQHAEDEEADRVRTKWLEERGYLVIRFWNNDVLRNCPGVMEKIMEICSR
jgi:very-short-patch-repair endonuclease